MAPVRGRVEQDIVRAALDAALEHGFERFVGGIAAVEAEIVAEQKATARARRQALEQPRQAVDVFAVDLDQGQGASALGIDLAVDRLDQRALAHAARPPEEGIVGRPSGREAAGVGEQDVAHAIDADQKRQRHVGDRRDRAQLLGRRFPDEGIGRVEVDRRQGRRRQALDRGHETEEQPGEVGCHAGPAVVGDGGRRAG